MTRATEFQNFFNNNPAIAGILVFVVVALIVVVVWFIIFFGSKTIKKRKFKEKKVSINKQIVDSKDINDIDQDSLLAKEEEVIQEKEIESNEKKPYVFDEQLIYFIVDFNKDGKLILKNMTKQIINDKPTKKDYYDSMLISSSRLLLPEKYIELRINQKGADFFLETSKPIEGRNLYIYNSLKRFLNENDIPWAISKFN